MANNIIPFNREERFSEVAPPLNTNGYRPIPLKWGAKNPVPDEWQRYQYSQKDLSKYRDNGTGILTGHDLVAIDIDIRDALLTQQLDSIICEMLGAGLLRIGAAPKLMRIYHAIGADHFAKKQTSGYRLQTDAPGDKAHRVEILGDGQQFVAFNEHPDTKAPYAWPNGSPLKVALKDLPTVTQEQLDAIRQLSEDFLAKYGTPIGRLSEAAETLSEHISNERLTTDDPKRLRAALARIPNDDLEYDDWITIGLAIKGALGEAGKDDWLSWSAKSGKDIPALTSKKWEGFKADHIGAGTIMRLAGWISERFEIHHVPLNWLTTKPPPKEFLIESMLPARTVALCIAESGTGKTTLTLKIALALATGRDFLGRKTRVGKIAYLALEDQAEDCWRRIYRQMEILCEKLREEGASPESIDSLTKLVANNLFILPAAGMELHVVALREGVVAQTQVLNKIISASPPGLSLLVVDPLARVHGCDENSNATGTALVNAFEMFTRETGASVLINHHVPKGAAANRTTDHYAARGASGLADAARVALRLISANVEECRNFLNCDMASVERGDLMRLSVAKANDFAKPPELWLRRQDMDYELFTPELSPAMALERLIQSLWVWWCARDRRAFPKGDVEALSSEIFREEVPRKTIRGLLAHGLDRGILMYAGAPRGATAALTFRDDFVGNGL